MNTPSPAQQPVPAVLFVRDNFTVVTVLAAAGDLAIEIPLTPHQAIELAQALLNTGLEVAQRNAVARTGALDAIAMAAGPKPSEEQHATPASPAAH